MKSITRYFNGRIIRDHQIKQEDLWVRDGKIISAQKKADYEVDVKGQIIAPGYIDLQINGAFGCNFSRESSLDQFNSAASQLPQYGVTAFLPTVVSLSSEQYLRVLPIIQSILDRKIGPTVLGIHLEGPFLNPERCGAHDPAMILPLDKEDLLENYYRGLEGVKLVTLAPEMPGARSLIALLRKRQIVVSAGHTKASYEVMRGAIDSGVSVITHLFNSMNPFNHRDPGVIGIALTEPKIFYSVIADGIHLHPVAVQLAWKANPDGLFLVTDAMEALGMPPGTYYVGLKEVSVSEGKVCLKGTQTLAGSLLSMDVAVRNLHSFTKCSIIQAIEAASLKPAQVLGIQESKGNLAIGADADFNILDDCLFVQACYIGGTRINIANRVSNPPS